MIAAAPVASSVYEASPIKPRQRSTRQQVDDRREALIAIVRAMHPMTVRQVFYQASVRGIVDKSEAGYAKVQTDLALLRRAGAMPYHWLADNTRWQRKPRTHGSIAEALRDTAQFYRKSLWASADCYVEVWLEKDALSGVVYPTTSLYDVPLMVARGSASLSFLHTAAEHIADLDVPTFIYHLGDYDPSGMDAGRKIEETLRELAPGAEIEFQRLAVTPEQITTWNLPSRPTKVTDSRARGFGPISVELDAIEPAQLRDLVGAAIEQHLPQKQLEVLKVAEESERLLLTNLVSRIADEGGISAHGTLWARGGR